MRSLSGSAAGGPARRPVRWRWVLIGAALGAALVTSFVWLTAVGPPRREVVLLVGALTLVLNGAVVAGLSPGNTIREAALAGGVLALLAGASVTLVPGFDLEPRWAVSGLVLAPVLAGLGGWVGEVMQGTLTSRAPRGRVQWAWVGAGTVLGVLLSYYALFVGHAVFPVGFGPVLAAFVASFGVMGFFVGYFSPGYTLLEPALAGIAVIAVDGVLAAVGFDAPFPLGTLLAAAAVGFVMGMAGGWLGESVRGTRRRLAR